MKNKKPIREEHKEQYSRIMCNGKIEAVTRICPNTGMAYFGCGYNCQRCGKYYSPMETINFRCNQPAFRRH